MTSQIKQLEIDIENDEKEYAINEYRFSKQKEEWQGRMKTQYEYLELKKAEIKRKKDMLSSLTGGKH